MKKLYGYKQVYLLLNGKIIVENEVIKNLNKEIVSKILNQPYWKFEEQFMQLDNLKTKK
jgi:hypothetical protein